MKSAKLLNIFIASVLLATFATGCKKNPKNITNIPGMRTTPGGDGPTGPIIPAGPQVSNLNSSSSALPDPWENAQRDPEALAAQTVYFEFDRSAIKTSEQPKLDAVATFLKANQDGRASSPSGC